MIRNEDFHGKTALHRAYAHDYGWEHTTKQAIFTFTWIGIENGADVNAQDNFGYTPAHTAAIGNNMTAMDALIDEDPELALLDQHMCTATDWALVQGQIEMADVMCEAGGVITQNYAVKLGAYHGHLPSKGLQKQYDMEMWSVAVREHSLERRPSVERRYSDERRYPGERRSSHDGRRRSVER